jgi:hypothetical protein
MTDPITSGFGMDDLSSFAYSTGVLSRLPKERLEILRYRIGAGVVILNRRYGLEWSLRIKASRIDFRSAKQCILGQLTYGYLTGLDELKMDPREAHLYGLNAEFAEEWAAMNVLWTERVEELRSQIGLEAEDAGTGEP